MNKKIEDAAKEFTHKVGLVFLSRYKTQVAIDSFKAGAEWALREAIEICEKRRIATTSNFDLAYREELEQLLSSEGEK